MWSRMRSTSRKELKEVISTNLISLKHSNGFVSLLKTFDGL